MLVRAFEFNICLQGDPMKRIVSFVTCIVLTALCGVPQPVRAQEAREHSRHCDFTDVTLHDRYGFHTFAVTLNPSDIRLGASVPFAVSGYYHFHGDGTLDGKDTVSSGLGGTPAIVHRQYNGTYHVDSDGTGWLILDISPTFQPRGEFVITQCGEQIEIIFAVTGNLNTFTLSKQHAQ
jgi:hypothetical protein